MTAFLIILGVPFLGVLLYVAEHVRRTGETPQARAIARSGVLICGAMLAVAGLLTLASTVLWIFGGVLDRSIPLAIVTFLTRVTAGVLMLWAARCAWRVFHLPSGADESASESLRERTSEQLRLAATSLILVPLLLLGVLGVLCALPVVLWGVVYRTTRQARQAQFLWTMALAVRQDLPLAEEVDVFAEPLWSQQKKAYHALSSRLRDGRSLGDALEMSEGILPRPVASEIRMAEEAGRLPDVLKDLATTATSSLSRSRFNGSLAVTLLYSWALLATFLLVVSFIMYFIIPKFKAIFNDFGIELPPMTISAIEASDAFTSHFLIVMPIVALPVFAALAAAVVYFFNWGNLNVPLLMRWFPRWDAPSLLRTLSHAVWAEQPLPDLVRDMSHRHLRSDLRLRLARMSDALERGEALWEPLRDEGFIRPVEADALAAAQRADNLPWAMRTLADSMDRNVQHRTQFWLEIAKPAVVLGIGLIVGWFVIAMFLPLVHLISQLS